MFSKELENLIQATLEDGKLEENEKAALVKRAQREGVDLDELEIYINSLMQKKERELNEKKNKQEEKYELEKKKAIGPICPKCGKQVPPLTLVCDCGYEFTSNKQLSSVKSLIEKIDGILSTKINKSPDDDGYKEEIKERNNRVRQMISMFPVPNSKEDIIEFLSLAVSKSRNKGGLLGTIKGRMLIAIPLCCLIIILCLIYTINLFEGSHKAVYESASEKLSEGIFLGGFLGVLLSGGIMYLCFKKGTDVLEDNKTAEIWREKFKQVIIKGRSLRGDSQFTEQLDYFENLLNEEQEKNKINLKKLFSR